MVQWLLPKEAPLIAERTGEFAHRDLDDCLPRAEVMVLKLLCPRLYAEMRREWLERFVQLMQGYVRARDAQRELNAYTRCCLN